MPDRPLLMIPGPVEVSPAVQAAFAAPPPSHTAPDLIESFGLALERMRPVWCSEASAQPFVIAGGGTVAMEMAAANLIEPGERALVVNTGYFSSRMVEILRRHGAQVCEVAAPPGEAPATRQVADCLTAPRRKEPFKALFATHVDTSTGVLLDPEPLARLAREHGVLSVFDGVCATGGERFEMASWGADVYLTASQKALGLPPGLALLVVGERAMEARAARRVTEPPMYLDWPVWLPIMRAYEERRPSYFSTPATNLIAALAAGLGEILDEGPEARWQAHREAARGLRQAWEALGLDEVPARPELAAHTLSALRFPPGVDASLVGRIAERGVLVAGGLHPQIRDEYFRVGHMGYAVSRPEMLRRTVRAVGEALREAGAVADPEAALEALEGVPAGAVR